MHSCSPPHSARTAADHDHAQQASPSCHHRLCEINTPPRIQISAAHAERLARRALSRCTDASPGPMQHRGLFASCPWRVAGVNHRRLRTPGRAGEASHFYRCAIVAAASVAVDHSRSSFSPVGPHKDLQPCSHAAVGTRNQNDGLTDDMLCPRLHGSGSMRKSPLIQRSEAACVKLSKVSPFST